MNVFKDLAEKARRDISAFVIRNCCYPTVWLPKLFVRTTLSHFDETKLLQGRDYLPRL